MSKAGVEGEGEADTMLNRDPPKVGLKLRTLGSRLQPKADF